MFFLGYVLELMREGRFLLELYGDVESECGSKCRGDYSVDEFLIGI